MSEFKHGIEAGDKVEILIGGTDAARYGMTDAMSRAKGEVAAAKIVDEYSIVVQHPYLTSVSYHPSELRKVEPERTQEFKKGDRVKIVGQGAYGSNTQMDEGLNGYGEVVSAEYPGSTGRTASICVGLDTGLGKHYYDHHELQTVVKVRGFKEDTVIVDDPAVEHIQSHDELVAENESLEKQIRKLEARVERKKEFQRKNVQKIAAWDIILGE